MSNSRFEDINLSIIGIGSEYPPFKHDQNVIDRMCKLYYPPSPALDKIKMINRYTGIETRSAIGPDTHPLVSMERSPNMTELCEVFLKDGVALGVAAARKALESAQMSPHELTHIVATTCTNSANPGYDYYVLKELGVTHSIEKVLMQGIGCSGGLAGLRTAAGLALGHTHMGRPARILVLAVEICSLLLRSELDSISETQETRIGVTLFSDCGSAVILSNGLGEQRAEPIYELLGWDHRVIPDTHQDLRFDAHPNGWKVFLSPNVPRLACEVVGPSFEDLMKTLPNLPPNYKEAKDFDWALHPGGSTILTGVGNMMSLTPEHMRASYDIYMNHGNSSSATIFSVMSRILQKDMDDCAPGGKVKDFVVACAFGPGVAIETCMLKRNMNYVQRSYVPLSDMTPPETESEGSRSEGEELENESQSSPVESPSIPNPTPDVVNPTSESTNLISEKLCVQVSEISCDGSLSPVSPNQEVPLLKTRRSFLSRVFGVDLQ